MLFLAFLNTIKIILENSILKYGLKRMGTSLVRPWSKMGPKLKSEPKTECQNRTKSYRVMPIDGRTLKLAYLGLKLTILATFLKISTSNLFCSFTLRLIGKPN